jgi:hypothetical protein
MEPNQLPVLGDPTSVEIPGQIFKKSFRTFDAKCA